MIELLVQAVEVTDATYDNVKKEDVVNSLVTVYLAEREAESVGSDALAELVAVAEVVAETVRLNEARAEIEVVFVGIPDGESDAAFEDVALITLLDEMVKVPNELPD